MPRSRALSQCLDIQNLAYETAMAFKTLPPSDEAIELHARRCVALAQVARAWESAVDRARILRGRPLPGSLKPKPVERRRRAPAIGEPAWTVPADTSTEPATGADASPSPAAGALG